MKGLLHDATEAYIGDMIRPVKFMLDDYKKLENKIEKSINKKFNLKSGKKIKNLIKWADYSVLLSESCLLFPGQTLDFSCEGLYAMYSEIEPLGQEASKKLFLDKYEDLLSGTERN